MDIPASIAALQERLRFLDAERVRVLADIEALYFTEAQMQQPSASTSPKVLTRVHQQSPESQKIALFRSLFRGRDDVFSHRWHNAKTGKSGYSPLCGNEWVKGVCEKPKVKCGECLNQRFIPVSDAIIRNHLRGKDPNDTWGNDFIAGVYPLLAGDTCWFLAADFDKEHWQRDAAAFLATCEEHRIPAALERSRSGNGGHVYPEQKAAVKALTAHDIGILAATTAFGKTVIAAQMIAKRKRNTLILVHRKQLQEQWRERLQTFLDVDANMIGSIGGGKRKPTGKIDIALLQSLTRQQTVDDLVANYGHVIVDECHHLAAVSFEAIMRAAKAKYVLGLSATVARKDGHHPIILMQCGPVRYHVDAKKQAAVRPFHHRLIWRDTAFQMPPYPLRTERLTIQEIYAALTQDTPRNDMIVRDVQQALSEGRKPLVLTERKEHIAILAEKLADCGVPVFLLHGGLSAKERWIELARLAALPAELPRLLIATGRYIGEGFDAPELDTLFLALPISWKGTLAQYAGRLHRLHPDKTEVRVYDYRDSNIPMLANMAEKRRLGYRAIGYEETTMALL